MTKDPFEKYATRYNKTGTKDPIRIEFFRLLLDKYRIKSVLDCACGTGNDLILLQSLGAQVVGSDVSEAMLSEARNNLDSNQIDLPLSKADFRELPQNFDKRFDAVLCLTTSLPQVMAEKEIIKALKSMRSVLESDGVLVLSQGLTDKQFNARLRFVPVINSPDFSKIMVIDYYEKEWEVHVLDLIHVEDESDFKVTSFRYPILLKDDYNRLLQEAGFSEVEFYGSFGCEIYDKKESDQLVMIAHK